MADDVHGRIVTVAPGVRRIVAPNPSPFTKDGTNSFIVGEDRVAIVDPGPDLPGHVAALAAAVAGETVAAILVTHSHRDHSPAARPLAALTGAPLLGGPAIPPNRLGPGVEAGYDPDWRPDRLLADGDRIGEGDWTLAAITTPGHTSNHLCFALEGTGVLFTGDHVMGWSTSVVIPPDGDMGDYMASLEKLMARDDRLYLPGHGEAVDNPARLVRGQLAHRKQREAQIMRLLVEGGAVVPALVARMYPGLSTRLTAAAGLTVAAHLIDLARRGLVVQTGDAWRVANGG